MPIKEYQIVILSISGVLFCTALLMLLLRFLERRAYRIFLHNPAAWNAILWDALYTPLQAFIGFLGLCCVLSVLSQHFPASRLDAILTGLKIPVTLLLLTYFVLRLIRHLEAIFAEKATQKNNPESEQRVDPVTVHILCRLLRISVLVVSVLMILQWFGLQISGILAFGGIGGIALGFAAKDLLANFFGGLMLFLDRPFKEGDWIRSPDKKIEGSVEHIGWRLTRIRTFDKRPLYVPNHLFSTILIENVSRMTNRRIRTVIGVRYCDADKISSIVTAIETMLHEHPDIDKNQTISVHFNEFAAASLNILLYAFTHTVETLAFSAVQQDIFLRTLAIIAAEKAECAFPTQTIYLQKDA